jgi:ribonuclease-3
MTRARGLEPARRAALEALQERLGHVFSDLSLLDRALTHKSCANEQPWHGARHNEPLEFLGDAVVGLAVADLLHRRDPDGPEGHKSFARAALVSEPSLARRADELGLPGLLRLGRGEEKNGGRHKTALWADAFEALVAGLYLDGGFECARAFLERVFAAELRRDAAALARRDDKSALQEHLQARGLPLPEYEVVAAEGPEHRRSFRVRCRISGEALSEGEGPSKKVAQQEAARRALELLLGLPAEGARV